MDVPHPSDLHEADAPLILLVDARTEVERGLIKDWMAQADVHPAAVLPNRGSAIARPLVGVDDEATVAAARVAWLPRERNGQRRVRWSDLVSLSDPRRPPARHQARIARREPDRAAVVLAEPATVGALRSRFGRPTDGSGAQLAFGDFVARQAALALERAERALVGDRYKVPRADRRGDRRQRSSSAATSASWPPAWSSPRPRSPAKAEADLHGLVASMSPMAVDLLTGVLRPLHARAWDVQVDSAGPGEAARAQPAPPAGLPAQPPLLRRPAAAGRRARRARFPAQPRARRRQPAVLADRPAGQARRDRLHPPQLRRRRDLQARRPRVLRVPAVQAVQPRVVHGGRPLAHRASCGRRATGCWRTSRRPWSAGRADDVFLVPVSITYDQLREVSAMAAEQVGAAEEG